MRGVHPFHLLLRKRLFTCEGGGERSPTIVKKKQPWNYPYKKRFFNHWNEEEATGRKKVDRSPRRMYVRDARREKAVEFLKKGSALGGGGGGKRSCQKKSRDLYMAHKAVSDIERRKGREKKGKWISSCLLRDSCACATEKRRRVERKKEEQKGKLQAADIPSSRNSGAAAPCRGGETEVTLMW